MRRIRQPRFEITDEKMFWEADPESPGAEWAAGLARSTVSEPRRADLDAHEPPAPIAAQTNVAETVENGFGVGQPPNANEPPLPAWVGEPDWAGSEPRPARHTFRALTVGVVGAALLTVAIGVASFAATNNHASLTAGPHKLATVAAHRHSGMVLASGSPGDARAATGSSTRPHVTRPVTHRARRAPARKPPNPAPSPPPAHPAAPIQVAAAPASSTTSSASSAPTGQAAAASPPPPAASAPPPSSYSPAASSSPSPSSSPPPESSSPAPSAPAAPAPQSSPHQSSTSSEFNFEK